MKITMELETLSEKSKRLILTDLCGRVPYRVKVHVTTKFPNKSVTESDYTLIGITKYVEGVSVPSCNHHRTTTSEISFVLESESDTGPIECYANLIDLDDDNIPKDIIKPYLRKFSDMTEEEKKIYESLKDDVEYWGWNDAYECEERMYESCDSWQSLDYLNSIHVDYRYLIPKGLALEAPEVMYKF